MSESIGILGFGFGGLMVLANLVARATRPLRVHIAAPDASGHGLAYGTRQLQHLLNVPVRNMGAWRDSPEDFQHWLATVPAALAQERLGLARLPDAGDFAPRALYAQYLDHIRATTLAGAQKKSVAITFGPAPVQHLTRTAEGWAMADGVTVARCVLATGNEVKPILPHLSHPAMVQSPWSLTREHIAGWGRQPVALVGTGLTAVDTVLSLRAMGYAGEIVALSRNGLWPQPHLAQPVTPYAWDGALMQQPSLYALLRHVRAAVRAHARAGQDWRGVVDALRPHTQALWQRLSPRDQQRFLRRLGTVWNIHRHRMAPGIHRAIAQEVSTGKLRVVALRDLQGAVEGGGLKLAVRRRDGGSEMLLPHAVVNCTGPELNWQRSAQPVLQQLLQQNHAAAHPTGLGVVADADCRIGDGLYAIGGLMTGQFLESTAVPELRVQAAHVAEALCKA